MSRSSLRTNHVLIAHSSPVTFNAFHGPNQKNVNIWPMPVLCIAKILVLQR